VNTAVNLQVLKEIGTLLTDLMSMRFWRRSPL